jgi:hypothetical protein
MLISNPAKKLQKACEKAFTKKLLKNCWSKNLHVKYPILRNCVYVDNGWSVSVNLCDIEAVFLSVLDT